MKFPKEDFPLIRTAVILLATAIILSATGITGSIYIRDLMQKNKSDDQQKLAEARTRLEQAHIEEQEIRLYHAKYLGLMEQGILGKEDRLEWIEHLGQIKENRKLFGLDYQIDAQQAVQTDPAIPQGNFALYGSTMKFGFSLLHEGDLLNTLHDLKKNTKQIGLLRECTLIRTSGNDPSIAVSPHLKAECTLAWLSLKPKSPEPIEPQ